MVIYDLICSSNHEFEGWFKNPEDMDAQRVDGLLTCPFCDSDKITKKPTASKISKKSNSSVISLSKSGAKAAVSHQVAIGGGNSNAGDGPEKFVQLQKMLRQVHNYIDQNFEDVGNRFSEEAISIHRGDKDAKNIRGTATGDQIKEMAEQGVAAIPLPPKPIDRKKVN